MRRRSAVGAHQLGRLGAALLLVLGASASGQDAGVPGRLEPGKIVVLTLESNAVAAQLAPGLSQSLAQRFADAHLDVLSQADLATRLGAERQQVLLGCSDGSCLAELSGALDAPYLVSGRVDRFGEKVVLNATLFDARKNVPILKSHREVDSVELLPLAVDELADELLGPFGVPPRVKVTLADRVSERGINLSAKLGTQLITSLAALAPVIDLELGYRLSLRWALFLQASIGVALGANTTATITPGLLGVRYFFRADRSLQPTLGGGAGILTTVNALQGKTRPSLVALGGLQYFFTSRVSVGAELSVDLLGLAFGFAQSTRPGVSAGLSLSVTYRF